MASELSRFDSVAPACHHGLRHAMAVAAPQPRAAIATLRSHSAAVWGTPSFVDGALAARARASGPAVALIEAFCTLGPECCTQLRGAFAFVVVNDDTGEALLAIDRMGIHNIVYCEVGDALVFGSTADAMRHFPGTTKEIDWQSIYNYVHFHMVPGPKTAIRGELRLPPGHYIHRRDGSTRLSRYWRMRFTEDRQRPFPELRDEFLSTLRDSVRKMSDGVRVGAFLSGGTDSSTISGLLGEVTGRPAETFSIGFAEQGYDEMEYARIAAQHFRTSQHEYYVTPADIVSAVPKLAQVFDQPFGNSSAVPTYCCAKFARDTGMVALLGGDGGDELFGGNDRYATQYLYSIYERVPAPLRTALLEPLSRAMPGGQLFPPIRWFKRLVELASTPMPDRLNAHNLLTRIGARNIFSDDMLGGIDLAVPQALMRDVYQSARGDSLINRMLAYDFQFTLADSDLPKVVRSCELAGLPVDFPMLDDGVVEFSAQLEPAMKLRGTRLRFFFKEALRDFLPNAIITKTKHGFGLPFGPWIRSHQPLRELVMDSLGSLRGRGFVRPDFLDRLMSTYLEEHAGYYGTMAWVLMMLELWLQRHTAHSATDAF